VRSLVSIAAAFAMAAAPASAAPKVCADCVRANMQALAGEDFHGRACGTADENAAARYVAERLKAYKVEGALDGGAYLQPVQFRVPAYASAPTLEAGQLHFVQGLEIVAMEPPEAVTGQLAVIGADTPPATAAGKVALYLPGYELAGVAALMKAGALAVIVPAPTNVAMVWDQLALRPPSAVEILGAEAAPALPVLTAVAVRPAAATFVVGEPVGRKSKKSRNTGNICSTRCSKP